MDNPIEILNKIYKYIKQKKYFDIVLEKENGKIKSIHASPKLKLFKKDPDGCFLGFNVDRESGEISGWWYWVNLQDNMNGGFECESFEKFTDLLEKKIVEED